MECLRCGACCRSFGSVSVRDGDRVPEELTVVTAGFREMAAVAGRCICLGEEGCKLYEFRPATCREFEPGGRKCLEAREGRTGMPLASLERCVRGMRNKLAAATRSGRLMVAVWYVEGDETLTCHRSTFGFPDERLAEAAALLRSCIGGEK